MLADQKCFKQVKAVLPYFFCSILPACICNVSNIYLNNVINLPNLKV